MLSPISDDDWPESLAHIRGSFLASANVYRTMAHHPDLLASWLDFRAHVVTGNALPQDALEVVILRTAFRREASYERAHHILRARRAGLDDARIGSVEGPPDAMADADALLASAVDALVDDNAVPTELQTRIIEAYGKEGLLDLLATVGFYTILAYLVRSFDTPVDDDVRKGLEADPFPR